MGGGSVWSGRRMCGGEFQKGQKKKQRRESIKKNLQIKNCAVTFEIVKANGTSIRFDLRT